MVLFILIYMKRNLTIIILAWSALLAAWTLASPPNGTIGATFGKIAVDASGNIGIATGTPMAILDINGTTTIRKTLDMTINRIVNVATPILGTDAVPMSYLTTQIATISSSTTRLWGEGRPGATVINNAGECTNTINGRQIKISKSSYSTNWDKSAAACPAGWWVCTAAERDINGAAANFGVCPASGASASTLVGCDPSYQNDFAHRDNIYVPAVPDNVTFKDDIIWVADVGANPHIGKAVSSVDGIVKDDVMCIVTRVWCCSY